MSTNVTDTLLLSQYAKDAVANHTDSDIEIALAFLHNAYPEFLDTSNDRLVKLGRRILFLVQATSVVAVSGDSNSSDNNSVVNAKDPIIAPDNLEACLRLLVEECQILNTTFKNKAFKVPRVPFGKTGLQMPIVTLGCMRFQQEWGPRITNMNQVGSDCQDNLLAILKYAIDLGMIHIETARGYGCSELQLGVALKQLFQINYIKREDLIIQTKIPANADPVAFREALELSLTSLQVEYVDLFSFHGMNFDEQMEWVFGEGNNCLAVVKEYMAAGRIRHLGFSTHGSTDLILQCIEKDVFEYVNLHYHYFGSYTASGGGHDGNGNLDAIKLLAEKNMGCFIISPFDKGGRLYAPSKKLCSLTLPDMEPMTFKSLWLWNHHRIYEGGPPCHTYTVGAARPADLDQPAVAAYLHATKSDQIVIRTKNVTKRLDEAKELALGKEWLATWWKGLPKNTGSKFLVEHNQIVWIFNSIKAFGMYEFGKARYNSFENNEAKWDESKSDPDNIAVIGKNGWGFVPGRPLKPNADYSEDLANVPVENKHQVVEAESFVYDHCRQQKAAKANEVPVGQSERVRNIFKRTFSVSAQIFRLPSLVDEKNGPKNPEESEVRIEIPRDWETAYDLRPWPDYPDQPSRA